MREYVNALLSMLAIILVIPGCKQPNEKNKAVLPQKQAAFSVDALETNIDVAASSAEYIEYDPEIEAKLYDIPTMVGSMPLDLPDQSSLPEGQMMLAIASTYDQEMITNFYNFEMERCGWQRVASIKDFESTLVFQKPKRICIISIRALSSKHKNHYSSLVHICTSNKDK